MCTEHSGSKLNDSGSNTENTSQSTDIYRDDEEELELDPDDEEKIVEENEIVEEPIDNEIETNEPEMIIFQKIAIQKNSNVVDIPPTN